MLDPEFAFSSPKQKLWSRSSQRFNLPVFSDMHYARCRFTVYLFCYSVTDVCISIKALSCHFCLCIIFSNFRFLPQCRILGVLVRVKRNNWVGKAKVSAVKIFHVQNSFCRGTTFAFRNNAVQIYLRSAVVLYSSDMFHFTWNLLLRRKFTVCHMQSWTFWLQLGRPERWIVVVARWWWLLQGRYWVTVIFHGFFGYTAMLFASV